MAESESAAAEAENGGTESRDDGGHEGHAHDDHGIGRYVIVFVALLFLTGLTVVTGRMDLGALNLPLAMAIASLKATLVVLFFMHLYDESPVNKMVFVLSVFFAIVMALGTFGDLWFRLATLLPNTFN